MAQQSANPQCPFCQLAANPEQTFDVHETEHFKAWLDINPRARGHTMIVPKEHLNSMDDIGEHVPELFEMIRIVMEKAKNGLDADGVSVVMNEGEAAGQKLEHFYAQVFPRFADEENAEAPAGAVFQPMEGLDESDLENISSQMENASFDGGGKPSKDGAATNIIQKNRMGGNDAQPEDAPSEETDSGSPQRQQEPERQQQPQQRRADEEQEESDDDDEEDEDKHKKHRSQWDGDNYSWDSDGAEFK